MKPEIKNVVYVCDKSELEDIEDFMSKTRKAWLSGIGCTGYEMDSTIFVKVPTGDILLFSYALEYLVRQGFWSIGWQVSLDEVFEDED